MTPQPVGVLATGSYLPQRVVTNAELAALSGADPEWIERKTRIRSRRYAAPAEATSDLAAAAARNALQQADLPATSIDLLIVATSTGDQPQPPTANLVQHKIGAMNAACVDLNAACSGFVYGLALGSAMLAPQPGRRALVIGADCYSRILDMKDPKVSVLAGDGAGAAILGPVSASRGFLTFALSSRGDRSDLIEIPAGGSRRPASHDTVASGGHHLRMQGRAVRDFVLEQVPAALKSVAAQAGVDLSQVDHLIPHQPNGVLVDQIVNAAGLTRATTHSVIDRCGNMGSASVAVTLDQANRDGDLRPGDLILLAGFGAGMSVGAGLLRWGVA